jgi:putative membrane protein
MIELLLRWAINAIALVALPYIIASIQVTSFGAALAAALVIGLINALIRPVLFVLTLPVTLLTLGLFTFVVNALCFWLAGSLFEGFRVAGFWPAFWGAIVYSIVSWALSALVFGDRPPAGTQ